MDQHYLWPGEGGGGQSLPTSFKGGTNKRKLTTNQLPKRVGEHNLTKP